MEEDQDEHYTSIRGRLLMLVNRIKGQAHKTEEPLEKEQAAPCEHPRFHHNSDDAIANAPTPSLGRNVFLSRWKTGIH